MTSKEVNKDETKRSLRLRSRKVGVGSDVENEQCSSGMSLDVLAHVASETLRNEPKSPKKSPRKKTSLRNIGSVGVLSLEQILGLTEKTILNLFTDVTSNEISRTFTFTCHLMPKNCQKKCSSFGSEMRARVEMRKHIYDHLNELEQEECNGKTKFTAEPLPVRRKRLMNTFMVPKRQSSKKQNKILSPNIDAGKNRVLKRESDTTDLGIKRRESYDIEEIADKVKEMIKQGETYNNQDGRLKRGSIGFIPVANKMKSHSVSKEFLDGSKDNENDSADSDEENEKRIEENEQFIIDLLSKTQPHHDHSYTTIFGRRKGADLVANMVEKDDEDDDNDANTWDAPYKTNKQTLNIAGKRKVVMFMDQKGNTSKRNKATPILFLRHRSPDENVPMVSAEEIIEDVKEEEEEEEEEEQQQQEEIEARKCGVSNGEKPYPPMPKSVLAKRGRLGFDISDIPTDGSDEEYEFLKKKKKSNNPLSREGREGNLGWEPKLALKFIRELKGRKKDDVIPLRCKICNDKVFTAAATLMYHYRSHAGIKPFVCLICNTTFTRQHSLNYHMLIHNNQSRFTCKDCGRKFRHPSHFKEHLRRHTGETPFECLDCGQRFKTRNTYKRHLKTRHGKLLTATGIHHLSVEEFAKVRTKRYNIPRLPDISYQMPELTFTKLKERKQDKRPVQSFVSSRYIRVCEDKSVTETEMKTKDEIKREVESDEEDPELEQILEALSETSSAKKQTETPVVNTKFYKNELEEDDETDTEDGKIPYTTGIYVNRKYAEIAAEKSKAKLKC